MYVLICKWSFFGIIITEELLKLEINKMERRIIRRKKLCVSMIKFSTVNISKQFSRINVSGIGR